MSKIEDLSKLALEVAKKTAREVKKEIDEFVRVKVHKLPLHLLPSDLPGQYAAYCPWSFDRFFKDHDCNLDTKRIFRIHYDPLGEERLPQPRCDVEIEFPSHSKELEFEPNEFSFVSSVALHLVYNDDIHHFNFSVIARDDQGPPGDRYETVDPVPTFTELGSLESLVNFLCYMRKDSESHLGFESDFYDIVKEDLKAAFDNAKIDWENEMKKEKDVERRLRRLEVDLKKMAGSKS